MCVRIRRPWRWGVFLLFPRNSIFFSTHPLPIQHAHLYQPAVHTYTHPRTHTCARALSLVYSPPPPGLVYTYIYKRYEVSASRDYTAHRDSLNGLLNYSDKLFEPAPAWARVVYSVCVCVCKSEGESSRVP